MSCVHDAALPPGALVPNRPVRRFGAEPGVAFSSAVDVDADHELDVAVCI
jgi:hypothetical protein